jgi:transcriptional regulator with XRE-family HTH domain
MPVSMIEHPEKKLKQLRELKNYTQEYMATQLGLSTRAYSKIEAGETQLTINRLNEISRVLGIEPMEILGFDHKNIFNNCTQEGDNSTMGTSTYLAPDKLMEQYEQRIKHLESEIIFLRALVK